MNAAPWLALLALVAVAAGIGCHFRHRCAARARCSDEQLDLLGAWAWRTDAEHRYTQLDERFRTVTGFDPADFIGRRPWDIDGAEATGGDWDSYRARLAAHDEVVLILSRPGTDGSIRHLELRGRAVLRHGRFLGYRGIGRDVTERLTTERALDESRRQYGEVIESVNEVIFRTDADGKLSFLNRAWQRLSGFAPAASLGHALIDFLHPDDRPQAEDMLAQVARGELDECCCQLRLRTHDGEVRWIEATGRRITDADGHHLGLAGTLDDISARKIAEMTLKNVNQELEARVRQRTAELEASNRELEAFSYSVSHDLRAPLRAIDGFARILEEELDGRLDDDARRHLDRIRRASQRMSHLIDALIELAHLTRQSLHKETFDLSEIALQIIEELRAEEPERKVEVEITRGLMVTADRTLARVLLENLLRNAWKFSAREPVAKIRFHAERDSERRVFSVEDNGAGFDMAFAGNLFRPFNRLHDTTDFPGTGIGLATVQRIIQRHGGLIWASSKPGNGARFSFTLGA